MNDGNSLHAELANPALQGTGPSAPLSFNVTLHWAGLPPIVTLNSRGHVGFEILRDH